MADALTVLALLVYAYQLDAMLNGPIARWRRAAARAVLALVLALVLAAARPP